MPLTIQTERIMNKESVFHLISDVTKQEGISCILIGGFAINWVISGRVMKP